MQLAVIPTFLAEISPVQMRGGTGVLYWLAIKCGGLVVTGITRATSNIPDNGAWQIPMGLIFIIPAIVLTLVWFIPEVCTMISFVPYAAVYIFSNAHSPCFSGV